MIDFCTFPSADFDIPILILVLYYTLLYNIVFCFWVIFCKDCCPCLFVFICKGLLSILVLSYSFGVCYMFTKDCSPCLLVYLQRTAALISLFCLQRTAVLVFCYSFAKDRGPCIVVFIFKGPLFLSLLFICKGLLSLCGAIYLQRIAVLVLGYSFTKDCGPCLMLFICIGLRYLFCAISLQRKLLFLLSTCCPSKIKLDCSSSKAWGTAFPLGLVKWLFHKLALETVVSMVSISL